jgi:cytochrome d ubiquinol oxidase subunit II
MLQDRATRQGTAGQACDSPRLVCAACSHRGEFAATIVARPDSVANYLMYPAAFVIPPLVLSSLAGIFYFCRRESDHLAFACSCSYLTAMMVGAAAGLYPRLLPSSNDPSHDLTIAKALSGPYALRAGLVWWVLGIVLAFIYFFVVYRMFRGKVSLESGGYEH